MTITSAEPRSAEAPLSLGPAPTPRLALAVALGLFPAVLSVRWPALLWATLAWDLAVLVLATWDFFRAPGPNAVSVSRRIEPVLSAGLKNKVTLELTAAPGSRAPLQGELRDTPPPGPLAHGARQRFTLEGRATVTWQLEPMTRGDLALGDVYLRLPGPLGLCARQQRHPARQTVKVYPDLTALSRDALWLARSADAVSARVLKRPAEGREFESLRDYRPGDDMRAMDWKASARRARPVVRVHQPEKNQVVLLLLDCGRHMAGTVAGRRKLDHAVDAALRLARVSLDQGDQVGVMAVASTVRAWLPPRRGAEQLKAIAHALYRVEATLEETDWARAFALAFEKNVRRALVVLLTDLLDVEASRTLLVRARHLVPRHLPVVASLIDEEVERVALEVPVGQRAAHRRQVAARLEDDVQLTVAQLREAGARVVRTHARALGPAAVNAYLDVKARGLL